MKSKKEENEENNNNNEEELSPEEQIEKNLPISYPRLEKLYRTCLKVQFDYDEAIKQSELNRINAQNEKNKNKKDAKGGKKR